MGDFPLASRLGRGMTCKARGYIIEGGIEQSLLDAKKNGGVEPEIN